ncbi:MAG: OadG family transporter subunit [Bacillota bacterium]|nr:OadG family transporter subunit [Bacillota bacterium]
MTLMDSLLVSMTGLAVVFLVLILVSLLIMLQSLVIGYFMAHKNKLDSVKTNAIDTRYILAKEETVNIMEGPEIISEGRSAGELKLLGVDEKTAAMIMAIVSDESQIPLCELQFKMIKAID